MSLKEGSYKINEMAHMVHALCMERSKGQSVVDGYTKTVGDSCILIVSEVVEFYESYRRGQIDPKEIADVVIRVMSFCVQNDIDLEKEILKKHEYNKNRPDHSIEERMKKGGKKIM